MNRLIKKKAEEYYQKIFNAGIPITALYLFGSAAKDRMHKASDIDICIVSPVFGKDITKERVMLMKLREGISDDIEPHPYSPADFKISYDPLAAEIRKTGIKISGE